VLGQVGQRVPTPATSRWVRVAVDGIDGAGKTTFADELAQVLTAGGRTAIRASVDDFHRVRAERYRRGRSSWLGFWLDSFDYPRLRAELLDPLGPGGSGRYRVAVHDLASDERLDLPWAQAPPSAVLVLDGLFLHRDELAGTWDFSVFLDVPFDISVARMAIRDGSADDPAAPSLHRYVRAQRHYFASCQPRQRATLVIDNSDLCHPAITPAR
jgi:uridine kinase